MMSRARSLICVILSIPRRSAAFCIMAGSVEMPTVKIEGTSMRMFCFERAFFKSTEMDRGVRSIKAYFWKKGHTNAAPL